jgi:hypothetical protein
VNYTYFDSARGPSLIPRKKQQLTAADVAKPSTIASGS